MWLGVAECLDAPQSIHLKLLWLCYGYIEWRCRLSLRKSHWQRSFYVLVREEEVRGGNKRRQDYGWQKGPSLESIFSDGTLGSLLSALNLAKICLLELSCRGKGNGGWPTTKTTIILSSYYCDRSCHLIKLGIIYKMKILELLFLIFTLTHRV